MMKIKFKQQAYQTKAVEAVVNCFEGQPPSAETRYRIDPGKAQANSQGQSQADMIEDVGFKNAEIVLSEQQRLDNIQASQRLQNLPQSQSLYDFKVLKKNQFVVDKTYSKKAVAISDLHLDIEMETGTGKTYCYIKTMFEMNKRFGWSKFIVVVPSIAIREGVYKSLEMTAEHFQETYSKKAKFFIYNSKQLHNLESFSSDAGINIMVINVQAFNARGKDNRRIYEQLDDFQSRRPIDVIKANRPILILDEPQKMEGGKTLDSLKEFNPLFVLRYSATHKSQHHKVHRLDALDAYNQKLVKKIAVRGISVKGLAGTNAYLYLESIAVSKQTPVARIELELKQKNGIKRVVKRLKKGDDLFIASGELDEYRGFVISDINAVTNTVEFTNGHQLRAGEATGDVNEATLRRIQIREAIRAHIEKEQTLFQQGIKVLTLFFIDEVAKYRVYDDSAEAGVGGEYAVIFEEEYQAVVNELHQDMLIDERYKNYLDLFSVDRIHNGYFSIDKKSKRLVDPSMNATELKAGETNDVAAYDLILKDKERLLSFKEPTRFIFSHSALREGWDNPNVFVICTLKHSDNTILRRQEVGRGLRIAVNEHGERQDNPATVHQTNVLTVVASESYKDFVAALQKEIGEALSERPRVADKAYFAGKVMQTADGKTVEISEEMAEGIEYYLIQNGYVDRKKNITQKYHDDLKNEELAEMPEDLQPYQHEVIDLIETVFSDAKLPEIANDRGVKTNPLNDNFEKEEFKKLWQKINQKAAYSVEFESAELVEKCIGVINKELRVTPLQYTVQRGEQKADLSHDQLKSGDGFKVKETATEYETKSIHSGVKYDLIGNLAEGTQLTRTTVANILASIEATVFAQFQTNPENFISEAKRLIQEQKATVIVEHIAYDTTSERYDLDIFTQAQSKQDFSKAGDPLKRHIYDYVVTDSKTERTFVEELDTSSDVVVYAKLPNGFSIPTPVGNYNPDWAISFKEGAVKHVYFVAETKGDMSTMQLRDIEKDKIKCARRFFDRLNLQDGGVSAKPENVKYDVIDSFSRLMDIVGGSVTA